MDTFFGSLFKVYHELEHALMVFLVHTFNVAITLVYEVLHLVFEGGEVVTDVGVSEVDVFTDLSDEAKSAFVVVVGEFFVAKDGL